jgi:plastocyanin
MTRILAVAALAAALLLVAAAAPSPAAAGSLSLKISPSSVSPFETVTLSGTVTPKLKRPAKLTLQTSFDGASFTTLKKLSLAKGATKYKTTWVAGATLGPIYFRARLGALTTQKLVVTVAVAASSAKAITAFTIPGQAGATAINETDKTIALTVPSGTDLTGLAPTLTITGASVSPASGVAHDFTGPVTYTVTAADASTQPYTVTVAKSADVQIIDVQIISFAFSPTTLTVKPGTTVVWTNNDPYSHTVTAVDSLDLNATPTGLFNSGYIAGGHTFRYTFTTPGTFFYECQIHYLDPAMHAQVIVQ